MCRPPKEVDIKQEALDVTGIKREDIEKAPLIDTVWPAFIDHVEKYNKKKDKWNSPIPTGMNIRNFDQVISHRMTEKYGKKGKDTVFMNTFKLVDLIDLLFPWFENLSEPENMKLDTLRKYFGLSGKGSHRALKDVEDTGEIIMRFIRFYRNLQKSGKIQFKNAFNNDKQAKV